MPLCVRRPMPPTQGGPAPKRRKKTPRSSKRTLLEAMQDALEKQLRNGFVGTPECPLPYIKDTTRTVRHGEAFDSFFPPRELMQNALDHCKDPLGDCAAFEVNGGLVVEPKELRWELGGERVVAVLVVSGGDRSPTELSANDCGASSE